MPIGIIDENADLHAHRGDEEVRNRLRVLVRQHSQTAIARRLGIRQSTVSRYLQGMKIPVEFCTSLIHEYGVNPVWLLTGEGTAYLSDATREISDAASNVVDMVRAMNAVMTLKLGTLAGGERKEVLRELYDSLADYQEMRGVLNAQVHPLFRELVSDFGAALDAGNMVLADELRNAALQLSDLCNDEELILQFDSDQAFLEHRLEHDNLALELQRKVVWGNLIGGRELDNVFLAQAANFVTALYQVRRYREARKVCRASLAMAEGCEELPKYRALKFMKGQLELDMGNINAGIAIMQDAVGRLDEEDMNASRPHLVRGWLMAGTISFVEAVHILEASAVQESDQSRNVGPVILRNFAIWGEVRESLKLVCMELSNQRAYERGDPYACALLQAMGEKGPTLRKEFEKSSLARNALREGRPREIFRTLTLSCQLARHCEPRSSAMKFLMEAEDVLNDVPTEVTLPIFTRAIHYKNALRLIPEQERSISRRRLRERALLFFSEHYSRGYLCFKEFA